MRLYREDRDKLYGTDVVSEQILSFLTSRPTRSCLAKELREIFFDVLSILALEHHLYQLEHHPISM